MDIQPEKIKFYRQICYLPSAVIAVLALFYCTMVYLSGEIGNANAGYKYLVGTPNYYLFYICIFPFIAAGIMYIAMCNINIRFVGKLNDELDEEQSNKVKVFRKLLLIIAVIFSLAVTINDASDKGRALPPFSIALASDQLYADATKKYFELKELQTEYRKKKLTDNSNNVLFTDTQDNSENIISDTHNDTHNKFDFHNEYFAFIKQQGYQGESITGFKSFSSWFYNSSLIYKMESFLSWIAALVISVFFVQLFLIIMVKDYIVPETKNLVLWLLILCSFWIPCKIFSVYYYSLDAFQPPAIVWFAIILLAISIVLALFIRVDKNDMTKYATLVVGVFSFVITSISIINPEYFDLAITIMQQLGWLYGGVILFIFSFSIYLVTDHLLVSYEKGKFTKPGHVINSD